MLSLQDPHTLNTDFALPSVPETEQAAPSNHHNSPKKGKPDGGISDPDPLTKQIKTEKSRQRQLLYLRNGVAIIGYFVVGICFYVNYEGWTVFDSLYFTVVTISTVGYGDESPSDDNSRLFTIFYLLFGIYIIFNGIYFMVNRSVKRMRNALIRHGTHHHDSNSQSHGRTSSTVGRAISSTVGYLVPSSLRDATLPSTPSVDAGVTPAVIEDPKKQKENDKQHRHASPFDEGVHRFNGGRKVYIHRKQRLYLSITALIVMLFLGAIFLWKNEGFSFITALFLAVETSTTVGYGDIHMKYKTTKIFMMFYIVISTSLVVYMLNTLHSITKSNRDILKRQQLLTQKESFQQSLNDLQRLMSLQVTGRTHSRVHEAGDRSPAPAGSGISMQSIQSLRNAVHTVGGMGGGTDGPPERALSITPWHVDPASGQVDDLEDVEVYGINEYQFVIFMLRHLQILNEHKHIQPWLKKFRELDRHGKGYLTIDELRRFCKVDEESQREQLLAQQQQQKRSFSFASNFSLGGGGGGGDGNTGLNWLMYNLQSSANKENLNHQSSTAGDQHPDDCENPLTKKLLDDQHYVSSAGGGSSAQTFTARAMTALRSSSQKGIPSTPSKDGMEHPEIRDVLEEMSHAEEMEDFEDDHENNS